MSSDNLPDKRDNLFDKIERYYRGEMNLSPADKIMAERWELAFAFLKELKNKPLAIKKYMEVLKGEGREISLNTAYTDFKNAELIFVPIHKISKNLHRIIIIEQIDREIQKLESRQLRTDKDGNLICGDLAYNDYQKQINRLLWIKIKATGLEHEDPNLPDFTQIQMPDLQVNISPKLLQMLTQLMKSGVIDTTELTRDIQDAQIVDDEEPG